MKYHNTHFVQLSRDIFTDEYNHLSANAKWLFVVLNELEHRYTGKGEDFFYRSNSELSKDSGLKLTTLKKAKAELLTSDLVESWQAHFRFKDGKLSRKHFTAYRILR